MTQPYPGSPSLALEARDKVLQTFRHTLQLARDGRNEEALLGCDFILKMDGRFLPARQLLEALRGVPPGTAVDLAPFLDFQAAEPAGEAIPDVQETAEHGVPFPAAAGGAASSASPASPSPKPAAPARSLDDLVFDDFPAAPAPPLASSFSSAAVASATSTLPPAAPPPPALEPEPTTQPRPSVPPAPPLPSPAAAAAPPPAPPRAAPAASSAMDPRIAQFLKQGDEAMARGNAQEAIDLWSRVFLIDLSNDEASRRIDAAREAQATVARKIDALLSEGIQLYDSGNLPHARDKFLEVLAVSDTDATARSYLSQIDAALAPKPSAAAAPAPESDFMKNELEAPHIGSFAAADEPSLEEAMAGPLGLRTGEAAAAPRVAAPAGRSRLDIRLLGAVGLVLLAAVAGATYWFLRRPSSRPAAPPARLNAAKLPGEDPLARADALFLQGKVDEAIQTLLAIPDNDPRHNEALTRIEQYKTSAVPTAVPPPPSAADLDAMRIAGMAALQAHRYIDAVKALDPVVKARPDDAESARALTQAHEQADALRGSVKSYNEGDYDSAIKLLWDLRKRDEKNQDAEDYLVNSYVNSAIQSLQVGNMARATQALQEALQIRSDDAEAQRLLKFSRKYAKGTTDLLARTFVNHLAVRP